MPSKQRMFLLVLGAALLGATTIRAQSQAVFSPGPVEPKSADAGKTPKVCVLEEVKTKKVVYSVVCQEFCVKHTFRPFHGLCCLCGLCEDDGDCCGCEKHEKLVLVKKSVPDKCIIKCVLKDAPPANVIYEKQILTPYEVIPAPAKK